MANARIDAILYALIKESLWGAKEPEPSYRCGRDEEGEGKAAAEEGKRSTKRDGSNDDAAPHVLSNNDMEAVIVFVDRDGSGEIDVGVSWFGRDHRRWFGCCSGWAKTACAPTYEHTLTYVLHMYAHSRSWFAQVARICNIHFFPLGKTARAEEDGV